MNRSVHGAAWGSSWVGLSIGLSRHDRARRHDDPPREPARPAVRHLRGEDASPSGYAASNAAPDEAEKGMDLRSGQPLAAGRDRAARWRGGAGPAPGGGHRTTPPPGAAGGAGPPAPGAP